MFTRNYDNIITFRQLCGTGQTPGISGYGDGTLCIKNWNNSLVDIGSNTYTPFANFGDYKNATNVVDTYGGSNLLCGYDENDITYEDYTINTIPNLNFVSHSISSIVYNNEANTYTKEYVKTLNNATSKSITINCVGVSYSWSSTKSSNSIVLVYKEKLPQEIEIPAGASITLKFKTTVTGNPNKPVEVSTSVE